MLAAIWGDAGRAPTDQRAARLDRLARALELDRSDLAARTVEAVTAYRDADAGGRFDAIRTLLFPDSGRAAAVVTDDWRAALTNAAGAAAAPPLTAHSPVTAAAVAPPADGAAGILIAAESDDPPGAVRATHVIEASADDPPNAAARAWTAACDQLGRPPAIVEVPEASAVELIAFERTADSPAGVNRWGGALACGDAAAATDLAQLIIGARRLRAAPAGTAALAILPAGHAAVTGFLLQR
jgi:hypothetical protein